jgi:hypothetical protein
LIYPLTTANPDVSRCTPKSWSKGRTAKSAYLATAPV